jgi:hypothetical protein
VWYHMSSGEYVDRARPAPTASELDAKYVPASNPFQLFEVILHGE